MSATAKPFQQKFLVQFGLGQHQSHPAPFGLPLFEIGSHWLTNDSQVFPACRLFIYWLLHWILRGLNEQTNEQGYVYVHSFFCHHTLNEIDAYSTTTSPSKFFEFSFLSRLDEERAWELEQQDLQHFQSPLFPDWLRWPSWNINETSVDCCFCLFVSSFLFSTPLYHSNLTVTAEKDENIKTNYDLRSSYSEFKSIALKKKRKNPAGYISDEPRSMRLVHYQRLLHLSLSIRTWSTVKGLCPKLAPISFFCFCVR